MKIGVNLTHLTISSSGAKTHFINLFENILNADLKNNYYFFLPKEMKLRELSFLKRNNTFLVLTNLPQQSAPGSLSFLRFFKMYIFFNKYFKNNKLDIFIHTSLPLIKNPHGKTLSNIFDIRYLHKDYEKNLFKRLIYKLILRYCLAYSDYIITISNFIKKEISKNFKTQNKKLKVLYCSIKNQKRIKENRKNFILSVGHYEERKNYFNLVKSFNILRTKYGYSGSLMIVSKNFTKKNIITEYIKKNKIGKFVHIKRDISNYQLRKYYASAELFVFPSIYEGFGLPILEALMQNCKILTSNINVFKEILGSRFVYFDPFSPTDISKKMFMSIENKTLLFNNNRQNKKILNRFNSKNISSDFLNFLNKI